MYVVVVLSFKATTYLPLLSLVSGMKVEGLVDDDIRLRDVLVLSRLFHLFDVLLAPLRKLVTSVSIGVEF